jgi:hypothetical protein
MRRAPVQKKRYDLEHAAELKSVNPDDVLAVWERWKLFHWNGSGRTPVLTSSRDTDIRRGIHKFGVKRCLDAVEGITFSEWHMGDNPAGKKYVSLDLIFREEWRVNKFVRSLAEAKRNGYISP